MSSTNAFWHNLPRPIIGLSPMDGVTDQPARSIAKKYGNPAVIYTEFTSVEEICRGKRHRALRSFLYDESQRPIVAQIYGQTPDLFRQVAVLLCELGFDGIDINMGCPSKSIAQRGAGAALIRTPEVARAIIRAVKQGVTQWQNGMSATDCPDLHASVRREVAERRYRLPSVTQARRPIPVSVKTRIGYDEDVVDQWIPTVLAEEPAALAVHGRTLTQRYAGRADWDSVGRAAALTLGSTTLFLGNGDISSYEEGVAYAQKYGLDGALIGRAALGNPFVFSPQSELPRPTTQAERHRVFAALAVEHSFLYESTFSHYDLYHFPPMRKHLNGYWRQMQAPSAVRSAWMRAESPNDVIAVLNSLLLLEKDEVDITG